MSRDKVPQAFPCSDYYGMTLRDYFAAKVMEAQIAKQTGPIEEKWLAKIAKGSYAAADAMLVARDEI